MVVINYAGSHEKKLSKIILENVQFLSFSSVQKLLRKKDIKICGKRTNKDEMVLPNSKIEIFVSEDKIKNNVPNFSVAFEDENVLIVMKPKGIEVQSKTEKVDLEKMVNERIKNKEGKIVPVHRIDRNTEGLVIFTKNKKAETELLFAIKNHKIRKIYQAIVFGFFKEKEATLEAYLKKDEKTSTVLVSSAKKVGFQKIITKYKVLEEKDKKSKLEIELVTGKTHQIRAHMAYLGHALVGDQKYGDQNQNKKENQKTQQLLAKKIVFELEESSFLSYLNKKTIETEKNLEI